MWTNRVILPRALLLSNLSWYKSWNPHLEKGLDFPDTFLYYKPKKHKRELLCLEGEKECQFLARA